MSEEAEILDTDKARFKVTASGNIKIRQKGGLRRRDPTGKFAPKEILLDKSTLDFCAKVSKIIREDWKMVNACKGCRKTDVDLRWGYCIDCALNAEKRRKLRKKK